MTLTRACQEFNGRFTHCIDQAQNSAAALINILITKFSSTFRDVFPSPFDDDSDDEYVPVDDADGRPRRRKNKGRRREVFFLKRAQILVADLWACFDRKGYGSFDDVDRITTFAGTYDQDDPPCRLPLAFEILSLYHELLALH